MEKLSITTLSNRARRLLRKNRTDLEAYLEKHPDCSGIYDLNVVNDILVPRSQASADTSREPSRALWGSCPVKQLQDPTYGMYVDEDFTRFGNVNASSAVTGSVGGWSCYLSAGAQINDANLEGGVVKLGSDGDDESAVLLSSTGTFRMVTTSTLAANRKLWYETRWRRSSITTDIGDYFVGLMKPTLGSGLPVVAQPITTTDDTLMTAGDFFGFHSNSNTAVRGGPTEIAVAFVLASGTVNYPTNGTTLMASSGNSVLTATAFVKTGFVFDPNGPFRRITSATARQTAGQVKRALIQFYINNLLVPMFLTADDVLNATATQAFPTAFMSPVIAVGNTAGSASNTLDCDWTKCYQEATT